MKKVILALIFTSVTLPSLSQKFTLGVKGGVQGYTLRYQDRDIRDEFTNGVRGGYMGGIFISFPLPDGFSLVAESMYSKKGRKVKFNEATDDNYTWINKSTYNFIENAIVLRKEFPVKFYNFKSSWYVNVGPNISYWTGGTGELTTNRRSEGLHYNIVFTDSAQADIRTMYMVDANRWLFGLDFGVGFMANVLGNQRFFAEMRFTYGHTYLGQSDSANLYVLDFDDNLRNAYRTLNFTIGYGINLDLRDAKKGKSTINKRKKREP